MSVHESGPRTATPGAEVVKENCVRVRPAGMSMRVSGTAMTANGSTNSPVGNDDYKAVLSTNAGESNRVLVERKASLSSKRTLQLLNRAAATQRLKTVASLFSFKTDHNNRSDKLPATIPASSREQAIRLYNGPTVSMSEAWEARHDSPGPQAYNEGLKWRDKFKNVPSVRIGLAKCERDIVPPAAPGPGDYDIAHPAVGERGNAIKFGDPAKRARYPPRTPDQPRAQVPCSYEEHTSSIQHHVTSGRVKSPAFPFSGAPRFQREENKEKPVLTKRGETVKVISAPSRPGVIPGTASTADSKRRGSKRRRKRRGGPRVFRRGDYSWLASCVEPKQWEPTLKLLDNNRPSTVDPSRSWALIDKAAPRSIFRQGQRHNPSEYNPQQRDLPPEKDSVPGSKYDRPKAFGRTGGRGGLLAPSASVSVLDRFPRGRLFPEEEMREREATPGPESYDVVLDHRLEGVAFEEMWGSLETLRSWESLGIGASDWPFAGYDTTDGNSRCGEQDVVGEEAQVSPRTRVGVDEAVCDEDRQMTEGIDGVDQRTIFGRSRSPCSAGRSIQRSSDRSTTVDSIRNGGTNAGECSRLSPTASVAAWRGAPCRGCLDAEAGSAAHTFVAAAASLSDANLFRRAQTTGTSICFGDMPRQRSAPAFSIGRGARDVPSRLMHTPADKIFKEARLGRSGPGPSTASSRAGDRLTRPRLPEARVVLPLTRSGGGTSLQGNGDRLLAACKGTDAVVVDGALGVQVKSRRPTNPSSSLAGPRRGVTLFHERLRYAGKELSSAEQHHSQPRAFFDAHLPTPATRE